MSNTLCVEFMIHDQEKFKHLRDLIFASMNAGIDGGEELGYEAVVISLEPELSRREEEEWYE